MTTEEAYIGVCPHSGGLPAEEFETTASGVRDAHQKLWRQCVGSRYVSRIFKQVDGKWKQVWREGQDFPEEGN